MKKNILNISIIDTGGAGNSAYRFHRLFKEKGHNSKLLVLNKFLKEKDIVGFKNDSMLFFRFIHKILKAFKSNKKNNINTIPKYHFLNFDESNAIFETKKIIAKFSFSPDLIFFYWISNFVNAKNIRELHELTGASIFWVMTDMGPLTGGCHYAWDCLGYIKDCDDCKAFVNENDEKKLIAFRNLEFKKTHLPKDSVTFITPTSKLKEQFYKSKFKNFKNIKILLPVDSEIFKPIDKKIAKKYFSIDEETKVIFIGTYDFNDERKGMRYLSNALSNLKNDFQLKENKIFLLIAGKNVDNFIKTLTYKYKYLNILKSDEALCYAYSAAEIFACPSIEDSGPMMINESILCGTPVVAFNNVGIADDLVITGETGYLANKKDINDFAIGIKNILNMDKISYMKMSEKCRNLGVELLSKDQIYKNQLSKLLNSNELSI